MVLSDANYTTKSVLFHLKTPRELIVNSPGSHSKPPGFLIKSIGIPGTPPSLILKLTFKENGVPKIEVETHKVCSPDVLVPTLDTVRHESLLYTWLGEHKPMVLCGPPGSGKTMTLFSALRALPEFEKTIKTLRSVYVERRLNGSAVSVFIVVVPFMVRWVWHYRFYFHEQRSKRCSTFLFSDSFFRSQAFLDTLTKRL
uniref:Uncharacterized protein n=1 Tax=Amphimedon queenslandica TaxID=400682 RepID=A0A1X7TKA9_AMPQE